MAYFNWADAGRASMKIAVQARTATAERLATVSMEDPSPESTTHDILGVRRTVPADRLLRQPPFYAPGGPGEQGNCRGAVSAAGRGPFQTAFADQVPWAGASNSQFQDGI